MARWKRSNSVPFPSIWSKFEGKKEINGIKPEFWIQDIPDELHKTIAQHMVDGFLADEPLARYLKISFDEETKKLMYDMWLDILKDRLGLVCFMKNPDPNGKPIIAGMNCTHLVTKDDPDDAEPTTENGDKIFETLSYVARVKDPFKTLGISQYIGAMGLYVLPEFRGHNLGAEILKARVPLGKAVGLKATLTVFTAKASQILADKAGFKDLTVMTYKELQQKLPHLSLVSDTEDIICKYILF